MRLKMMPKIIAKKAGLILLWGGAMTMAMLMIGLFHLWSAAMWLGTPVGQKSVQDLLPAAIAGIPYTLEIDTKDLPEKRLGISLSALVLGRTIEAKAQLVCAPYLLTIESLYVQAPDLRVSGSGNYNVAKNALVAEFSGTLDSLKNYPEFVGSEHNIEPLSFDVSLNQQGKNYPEVTFDLSTQEYRNQSINLSARDVSLQGSYANGTVSISSLSARDHDKGTISASGTYNLQDSSADIKITSRDFNLVRGGIASGVLDGDLTFQGSPSKSYDLKGAITSQEVNITIPERISGNVPQLNVKMQGQPESAAPHIAENINLYVRINAPRRVMVRGWGLDAEFGGALDIKGTAAKPLFYGSLESLRGRYSEFGKLFKFTNAKLDFSGAVPPSPSLDIEAKTKAGDITAIINISGSVMEPKISFSSQPPLPEDEVLSHILFGKRMENISPFQAVQLAQTLSRFTGQGGGASSLDPISTLRNLTGLDDLRVEMNEQGAASVGAGKYLSDNVYLEFETGTQEGGGNANVEIELSPNITLESEIGQDASGGAGLFWKWDY